MPKARFIYVTIEDIAIRELRLNDQWSYKGMSPELLEPLIELRRKQVIFLGICRILRRLLHGDDFKLIASWDTPWRSLQGVLRELTNKRDTSSVFKEYSRGSILESEDKAVIPWVEGEISASKYTEYIAADTFSYFTSEVGTCRDARLYLNCPAYINLHLTDNSSGNTSSYVTQIDRAKETQERILTQILKGHDLIVHPYGYSLRHLLLRMQNPAA